VVSRGHEHKVLMSSGSQRAGVDRSAAASGTDRIGTDAR
jgi:hypothetical protein